MNRFALYGLLTSMVVALGAGCGPSAKERIAQLEQTNQSLLDELQAKSDELNSCHGECDGLQKQLAMSDQERQTLRGQLASKPKATEAMPQGWQKVPGASMIAVEGSVLFKPGKAVLRTEAKQTLDNIAKTIMQRYSGQDVYVYGHTDDTPIKKSGWKDNYELSAQRSLSVVRDLQSRGVPPKLLVACGCGEHRPAQSGSGDSARSKNRRVEIYVLDKGVETAAR